MLEITKEADVLWPTHTLSVQINNANDLNRALAQLILAKEREITVKKSTDYAGIKPSDLSLVVLTVTGPATSPMHDLKLNSFLQVERNQIPTRVIPHHLAHAVSAFATSGFAESAVLVVDGIGSVLADLSAEERRTIKDPVSDGWGWATLFSASGASIKPLEKHMTPGFDWFSLDGPGMAKFRILGTIFSTKSLVSR